MPTFHTVFKWALVTFGTVMAIRYIRNSSPTLQNIYPSGMGASSPSGLTS